MWSIVESYKDVMPNFVMCMRFDIQDGQGFSFGKIFGAEMSLYWWFSGPFYYNKKDIIGTEYLYTLSVTITLSSS